jgi:hypothetical protein
MRAFGLSPLAVLLAGCVSTQVHKLDEWGAARNCHISHVTKKEFETALSRVFAASHPKSYALRPQEGGALVEQHWQLDVVLGSASIVERWQIEYAVAGDGIDSHADREHIVSESTLPAGNGIPGSINTKMYKLLWARLAYVLGTRTDWPACKSGETAEDSGLCAAPRVPPFRAARSH